VIWVSPVRFDVTSPWGIRRDPLGSGEQMHKGIDVAPHVVAVAAGKIVRVDVPGDGKSEANGSAVWLECLAPDGRSCWVGYLHLDAVRVRVGQTVLAGAILGTVGETGRATGVHLHFCVFRSGLAVDPTPWFRLGG
jgi:murein DD-endopeptidase MepM/ murein hydrolase activator NlpD